MKKKITILLLFLFLGLSFSKPAIAVENPLGVPNNKFGVHILFTHEIKEAAELVNSNGGDWGYAIIPIQSGDKDLFKWQGFMDEAKKAHVIPIVRLATEGDYFNTKVWRKPVYADILDFYNFLNSLYWPTKNRYIVVFNEPNRGDEWGGVPSPKEYAEILSFTASTFKSKNQDFFIISAGLDNAAANVYNKSYDNYEFLRLMNSAVPGIFSQIDGISSHSYPNPAFSQPPKLGYESIGTYKYEKSLIESLGSKDLPVFITETGWSTEKLLDKTIANYYSEAFQTIWNDQNIVAITPFLLRANSGPFTVFSLFKEDGSETEQYKTIQSLPKALGKPQLSPYKAPKSVNSKQKILGEKDFSENKKLIETSIYLSPTIKNLIRWFLKI